MKPGKFIPNRLSKRLIRILYLHYLLRSDINSFKILWAIILNRKILRGDYILSNYGVWMFNREMDRTLRLSIFGYRNNLEKILSSIMEPTIFLDIGANQGVFSLVAAANQNIVEIHSFEPNTKICKFLQLNFVVNNVLNYTIHEVAVSTNESNMNFLVPENHSGAGRISSQESNMTIRTVNHVYLDEHFAKFHIPFFVKIDVEGHELKVLQELLKSKISPSIQRIYLEIIRGNQNEATTLQILRQNGFSEKFRKSGPISYDALFVR